MPLCSNTFSSLATDRVKILCLRAVAHWIPFGLEAQYCWFSLMWLDILILEVVEFLNCWRSPISPATRRPRYHHDLSYKPFNSFLVLGHSSSNVLRLSYDTWKLLHMYYVPMYLVSKMAVKKVSTELTEGSVYLHTPYALFTHSFEL